MFRTLINDAKSAAGAVIGRYAVRASVAVPFVISAGFGAAALTLVLVEKFGALPAYCMMAGGFAVIGLIASVVVTVKEQEEAVVDAKAENSDTADVATDAAALAAVQLPLALLGTLLTTPLGPGAAMGGVKMLGRNLPLVLLLVLLGLLFWPAKPGEVTQSDAEATVPPDETFKTSPAPARNGVDRHAA